MRNFYGQILRYVTSRINYYYTYIKRILYRIRCDNIIRYNIIEQWLLKLLEKISRLYAPHLTMINIILLFHSIISLYRYIWISFECLTNSIEGWYSFEEKGNVSFVSITRKMGAKIFHTIRLLIVNTEFQAISPRSKTSGKLAECFSTQVSLEFDENWSYSGTWLLPPRRAGAACRKSRSS